MVMPIGPYTPAVRSGSLLFCSGQIGIDAAGELSATFETQVRQAMTNLEQLLGEYDATLASLVKTTIFLTDMADFGPMNALYEEVMEGAKPARSSVAVAALPKGARFEIEAIADLSSRGQPGSIVARMP